MNKKIKLIIFFIISFVISQILVKLLSESNFIKSPMYILLPVVGFFMTYYITPSIMKFVDIKNKNIFLVIFIVFSLVSFYIALLFYFWNIQPIIQHTPIKFNYIKLLLNSAFIEFIISSGFGILAIKK